MSPKKRLSAMLGVLAALAGTALILVGCTSASPAPTATPDNVRVASAAPIPNGFTNASLLVDTQFVERNLTSADVRVLDVRDRDAYLAGHIPNAVHVPTSDFTVEANGIPNLVAAPDDFSRVMSAAGVGPNTQVVIVDAGNMLWASRMLWTLDYYGHQKTSVLHGGMAAWTAEQRPVTGQFPTVQPATFTATPNAELVADVLEMLDRLDDPQLVVLDNRSPKEYTGEDVRADRGGHIPGAVNIDWTSHLVSGDVPALKTPDELRNMYVSAGITPDKTVSSYCQTAIRATHGYMVLRLLGYEDLEVYDGSWVEWGNREDTPIEA